MLGVELSSVQQERLLCQLESVAPVGNCPSCLLEGNILSAALFSAATLRCDRCRLACTHCM